LSRTSFAGIPFAFQDIDELQGVSYLLENALEGDRHKDDNCPVCLAQARMESTIKAYFQEPK
jgi:hypothetical protein